MGLIITPQSEIDAYFESDALGQSKLKRLLKGLRHFKKVDKEDQELYYEEKGHFLMGSAVDTILTGEEGEFNRQYYVSEIDKKPSDVEMSMCQYVFDVAESHLGNAVEELSEYRDMIQLASEREGWYGGKPGTTRISSLIEKCSPYFEELKASHNKQILSKVEYDTINMIVTSLKTNPRTSKYFDRETLKTQSNVDVYYQLPVYFTIAWGEVVSCKALLDMVIVTKDGEGKIISIEPIDIKTMSGGVLSFPTSVRKHRYDIQAAWYKTALRNLWSDDRHKILPFKFIVESTTSPGEPVVFEDSEGHLDYSGNNGRYSVEVGSTIIRDEIKGYKKLLEDYVWYEKNGWDTERIIKENRETIKIDWNGIKENYGN